MRRVHFPYGALAWSPSAVHGRAGTVCHVESLTPDPTALVMAHLHLTGTTARQLRDPSLNVDGVPPADVPDDCHVLRVGGPHYPTQLAAARGPVLLYVRGNLAALSAGVAIVGTRAMTRLGDAVVRTAVEGARDAHAVTISGLADGCDRAAAEASLALGVPHVAVVASGATDLSPSGREDLADRIVAGGGAIVSEHPFGVSTGTVFGTYKAGPYQSRLVARNRIIAGLAATVVLAEGGPASGALHTVWAARSYGRTVLVARPRKHARADAGAQAPMALAEERNVAKLRRMGMPAAVSEQWTPGDTVASGVADSRDELRRLVMLAARLVPRYGPAIEARAAAEAA